jgi:hypothetical protein
MKYTMVKQFSNAAIDNLFSFFFKIWDFIKVLYEAFWAFLEIWAAFFLIFYNIFMYFYYFLLFLIDRGSEESGPIFRLRRMSSTPQSAPRISIPSGSNPVPYMYGGAKTAATAVTSAATAGKQALSSLRSTPSGSGAKPQIFKIILEAIADFFIGLKNIIVAPFKTIVTLFDRFKATKEKAKSEEKPKSLIAEYMKEYEQRKK